MQVKCCCICRLNDGQILFDLNRTGSPQNFLSASHFSSRFFHQNLQHNTNSEMDKQLFSSFSSQQQQPQQPQQKNYEINRTMLTTADEGFYFSFIDENDIVYTVLCESEFPLKQAQMLLNRIKRELKNMPDYFRQSVNSIQTFARTFIVPIISQMDEDVGKMIGQRQRQERIVEKQEQVQKQQQKRQNDEKREKEEAQQQLRAHQQQKQQQSGEETTIIQFLENEEDDDEEEAEEQKQCDREQKQESSTNLAVERHRSQQQPSKNANSNHQECFKTFESSKNQSICDNDNMNHSSNGLRRNRRIKTLNYFQKGKTNQNSETPISNKKEGDAINPPSEILKVENVLKPSCNKTHHNPNLLEELPQKTFVSSPCENPMIFISNSSGNPGIFASTNGSYDPRKELLGSNDQSNEKQECTRVQENIKITAFEDNGSSKCITSTDINNKQTNQEIYIAPQDSPKCNNNNNTLKGSKASEKYVIFSSCREINCSIKEIDHQSSDYSQKKLSQTCSVSHQKNQEYYLDDIQIQIDKSHKFNTESSAHPSNFSTADQKQTADMVVLKQLKLKDCGIYDEEQNREDVKQHNKEEIEKMQQKQMKNAANLRRIKIKVIACILVLSVVLSITLPLIK